MTQKKICFSFVLLITISLLFASCTTYKNVPYLQDYADTAKPTLVPTVSFTQPVIQPDDILSVNIQSIDASTGFFNKGDKPDISTSSTSVSTFTGGASTQQSAPITSQQPQTSTGYLVDKDGCIQMPLIGKIKVAGLTTFIARDTIYNRVARFYNYPVVDVRFVNFKVTVLGEVLRPASYTVPNEKITVFDALGLAGDLTIYGKRENVLLMRDSMNQKLLVRLNLNSKNIITSPYFFLKQNDVLYVEPNSQKIANIDASRTRNYTIAAAILSLLIVVASRVK